MTEMKQVKIQSLFEEGIRETLLKENKNNKENETIKDQECPEIEIKIQGVETQASLSVQHCP